MLTKVPGFLRVIVGLVLLAALVTGVAAAAPWAHHSTALRRATAHESSAASSTARGVKGAMLAGTARAAWLGFKRSDSAAVKRMKIAKLTAHFAVFRRSASARTAADSGPAIPADGLESAQQEQELGLVSADTQYVSLGGSFGVWLTPGSNGACIDWPTSANASPVVSAGVCNPNVAAIALGGLFAEVPGAQDGGASMIVGMAPDGTKSVSATMPDGSVETVAPHDNVFSLPTPGATPGQAFSSLRITATSGKITTW
jgi:hypothetical protein